MQQVEKRWEVVEGGGGSGLGVRIERKWGVARHLSDNVPNRNAGLKEIL